jgi:uncharacterized protein with FMN-binding domain
MESSNSPNKAIVGIIVVAILAIVATAVIVLGTENVTNENNADVASSPSSQAQSTTDTRQSDDTSSSQYKNGSYTADGSYQTPGGRESIGVTVTLTNGTITAASVEQKGERGESKEFQSRFASGFESQVIGKNIDEVSLTRVAGSSLTPNGFNNALDAIKDQAET